MLEDFWRDFKPKAGEVMEQKPSDVTAALDDFLAPWLFPDKGDGSDPRLCRVRHRPAGAARRQVRRLRRLLQLSGMQYTRRFGQGEEAASEGPRSATGSCSRAAGSGPI